MASSKPFAYNTGAPISGTTQYGDIAVGDIQVEYSADYGGVKWWGGPDEDIRWIIGSARPSGQPVPPGVTGTAEVGFWGSRPIGLKTDETFLDVANYVGGKNGQPPFATTTEAEIWLNANGFYTNYSTVTPTPTVTPTDTVTPTPTQTPTDTVTPTPTPSITASQTLTPTPTQTPSLSMGATPNPTTTPTPTPSITPSETATQTPTPTQTETPTTTPSPTPTLVYPNILFLGDSTVSTVASNISTYITQTGGTITYSAVTLDANYTGSGNITTDNYDAVVYYTNTGQRGNTVLSTVLSDYVNNGGNLVSGALLWSVFPSGYNHSGTTAFNQTTASASTFLTSYTVITPSVITQGVETGLPGTTIYNTGFPFPATPLTLSSGAILLASYNGLSPAPPLLAYKQVGNSTLVSVNAYLGSINTSGSTLTKLVGNSILFAVGDIFNPTPTPTATITRTPTNTPTNSQTPTNTPTNTPTPSITASNTVTPTVTPTNTPTPSITASNTVTPTVTPTNTATVTPSITATNTETPTNTPTQTNTETPTNTPTQSSTPTLTPTNTPTQSSTPTLTPTNTSTPTPTPSEPFFLLFEDSSIATTENDESIEIDVDMIFDSLTVSKQLYLDTPTGQFLQVTAAEYANVKTRVGSTITYGMTDSQASVTTGTTLAANCAFKLPEDSITSPAGEYIIGYLGRFATGGTGNFTVLTGSTYNGTFDNFENTSFVSGPTGVIFYYVRKAPSVANSTTTYVASVGSANRLAVGTFPNSGFDCSAPYSSWTTTNGNAPIFQFIGTSVKQW